MLLPLPPWLDILPGCDMVPGAGICECWSMLGPLLLCDPGSGSELLTFRLASVDLSQNETSSLTANSIVAEFDEFSFADLTTESWVWICTIKHIEAV